MLSASITTTVRAAALGAAAFGLSLALPSAGHACQIEIDHVYGVFPEKDDGLSNAERVDCPVAALKVYHPERGWSTMRGEDGKPFVVRDLAGVMAPPGELIAVVTKDGRVALHWGGPGNGNFIVSSEWQTGFYLPAADGRPMKAQSIKSLSLTPDGGRVQLTMNVSKGRTCTTLSDNRFVFSRVWRCEGAAPIAAATAKPAKPRQPATSGTPARKTSQTAAANTPKPRPQQKATTKAAPTKPARQTTAQRTAKAAPAKPAGQTTAQRTAKRTPQQATRKAKPQQSTAKAKPAQQARKTTTAARSPQRKAQSATRKATPKQRSAKATPAKRTPRKATQSASTTAAPKKRTAKATPARE